MNLTKENLSAAIAKLKAKGKPDAIEFDDHLRGFGLRLQGKRQSWIIQYRVGFKQRRLRIGDAAKVSPDEARKNAKKSLLLLNWSKTRCRRSSRSANRRRLPSALSSTII